MISRLRSLALLSVGLAFLGLALFASPGAHAQGKKEKVKPQFKRVTIKTFDGVSLAATYYPPTGKKDAVVMLLHHIDAKKGGNQQKDGWGDLAARLQREGYAVLSFDFRGFGDSKEVDTEFWKYQPNSMHIKGKRGKMLPTAIDHKDFQAAYYRYLVNDITAAKAYLDRRNDDGEINTSNTIVIGAGEGTTLGALWLAQECRKKRDKNPPPMAGFPARPPMLAESEGKDVACAVWLSISPTLAGGKVLPLSTWLYDAGKNVKVPMAFVYGKGDTHATNLAKDMLKRIKGAPGGKGGPLEFTGEKAIPGTKLSGTPLLSRGLDTESWIVDSYLAPVLEKRGAKERRTRHVEKWRYYYDFRPKLLLGPAMIAKREGEDVPRVNLQLFWSR